jgi:hypothetical protein
VDTVLLHQHWLIVERYVVKVVHMLSTIRLNKFAAAGASSPDVSFVVLLVFLLPFMAPKTDCQHTHLLYVSA